MKIRHVDPGFGGGGRGRDRGGSSCFHLTSSVPPRHVLTSTHEAPDEISGALALHHVNVSAASLKGKNVLNSEGLTGISAQVVCVCVDQMSNMTVPAEAVYTLK